MLPHEAEAGVGRRARLGPGERRGRAREEEAAAAGREGRKEGRRPDGAGVPPAPGRPRRPLGSGASWRRGDAEPGEGDAGEAQHRPPLIRRSGMKINRRLTL